LLDYAVASNKYRESTLKYHYRCNYKELINFSNYAFYNNELIFATKFDQNKELPIETINIDGKWDKQKSTNMEEVNVVVDLIKNILVNRKDNETIGIVTLNVNQRNEILKMLDEKLKDDADVASIYMAEKERVNPKTGEDESIFVKNLEGVQGDERDIIIFSIAYSKDGNGRIGSNLGEIQRQYGENRLNVAISRAKRKIYIVKSFMGDDLTINEDNLGPTYFKKYLQYVDALNKGDNSKVEVLLNSLVDTPLQKEEIRFDSGFEQEVYDVLESFIDKEKYEVRTQIKVGSFSIDLGIYDKEKNNYLLGIECDGALYHSGPSKIRNDICRQYYLENRGWKIYRIWSTDWWLKREEEVNKLKEQINEL
jgi:very-short-patch-repair endonuclease